MTPQINAMKMLLTAKIKELHEMQAAGLKYQLQQGTKEDIYRIKRDISEMVKEKKHGL